MNFASITRSIEEALKKVTEKDDAYDVYLKNEKENDTFHFPVNPLGSITLNRNKKYDTVDIVDFGEVDLSDKGKKIKELSFSTLLPKEYDTYCRYNNFPTPKDSISKLEKWMEQEEPVRLIITGFNFNDLVTISKIDEEERAGEAGDKYINISFRTHRELKIQKAIDINNLTASLNNNRPTAKKSKKIFTVGEWIVITADTLPVRDGPNDSHKQIGTLKKEQSYKIGRIEGNWADIYWGNHGGWICTDYVK